MFSDLVSPTVVMAEYACNLEKKQRNLIKRKTRLETYRQTLINGGILTPDQEKAVAEYDSVCQLVDGLKETIDIINEIQVKVDLVVKENEGRLAALHEKYAVDLFQKICPVLELLSKASLPSVKDAIIKATSRQQYKVLENASKTLNVRPPIGFKYDDTESSDLFKQSAEYMFKLAVGAQVPVNGKSNKSRFPTFADLRQICYGLLVNEEVRAALVSPLGDLHKSKLPEQSKPLEASQITKPQVKPVCTAEASAVPEKDISDSDSLPAEAILNSVINPLKTSFNFLQASQVGPAALVQTDSELAVRHPLPQSISHSPVLQERLMMVTTSQTSAHYVESDDQIPVPDAVYSPLPPRKSQTGVPVTEEEEQKAPIPKTLINERIKSKHKFNRVGVVGGLQPSEQSQSQVTSLQAVMDDELAQQQASRPATTTTKSWADRVRGTQAPSVSQLVSEPTQPSAQTSFGSNTHRDPQPPRNKLGFPRENRPSRSLFNEGDANGRSGHPRNGFRVRRGRGNGMPSRGGRVRGTPRNSFYSRGGFDAQSQRQAPVETVS